MYFALMDGYDAVLGFMDRGGGLLWVIATLLLVKFSLVFERVWYLHSAHAKKGQTDSGNVEWQDRQKLLESQTDPHDDDIPDIT
jgi:hypothetical protein